MDRLADILGGRAAGEGQFDPAGELLEALLATLPVGVFVADVKGRLAYANPAGQRIWGGFRYEAPENSTQYRVLHPGTEQPYELEQRPLARAMRSGEPCLGESIEIEAFDGVRRTALVSVVPLRGESGEVRCFLIVYQDVTETRRSERELEEKNRLLERANRELRTLMDITPAAIFIARDPDANRIEGNRTAYELTGVPPGGNISSSAPEGESKKYFQPVCNGEPADPNGLAIQIAARTGKPVYGQECNLQFPDGTVRNLYGHAVPLLDETGRSQGAIAAFVDVTERRAMEGRLREAQKLENIGVLAGGVAHRFNNLLTAILGNATLARSFLPRADAAGGMMDRVIDAAEQAAGLTRQLIAYSGRGHFFFSGRDLSEQLAQSMPGLKALMPDRIQLIFRPCPVRLPVEVDAAQIEQALANIVTNAVEAIGDRPGSIEIDCGPRGGDACIQIRDDGPGMDRATLEKCWDPFFTTRFTGRGLGLAAVQGIVRAHRGRAAVESRPGKGCCFTLLFPLAEKVAAPAAAPALAPGWKVLVVDDETMVLDIAATALSAGGREVRRAVTGAAAIEAVRSDPGIGLVLLDWEGPELDGLATLREIRQLRPDIPVIVWSGYSTDQIARALEEEKVSGYIQKPVRIQELLDRVNRFFPS